MAASLGWRRPLVASAVMVSMVGLPGEALAGLGIPRRRRTVVRTRSRISRIPELSRPRGSPAWRARTRTKARTVGFIRAISLGAGTADRVRASIRK